MIDGSTSFGSDALRWSSNSCHLQVKRSKQEMTMHKFLTVEIMWGGFYTWFYVLISKIYRESILTRFSNQLTRIGFQELGSFGSKCLWPCVDLKISNFRSNVKHWDFTGWWIGVFCHTSDSFRFYEMFFFFLNFLYCFNLEKTIIALIPSFASLLGIPKPERYLLGTLAPAECLRGVELDMSNPGNWELQNLRGRNSNLWRHLDIV